MNIETIIISGITAFLGALAAISFQSWREHRVAVKNKQNVISQCKSLLQQDLLTIETFFENAVEQNNAKQIHVPPKPPNSSLTNNVTEKLAEYLTDQEYELVTLAQLTFIGSVHQAEEVRRLYYEFESRSLGAGRKFNKYEVDTLQAHINNYIQVVSGSHAAHKKAYELLIKAQKEAARTVFDKNFALKNIPALILIYVLFISYSAVLFFILWRQSV